MKVSSVPSNVISSPVLDKSSSLLELIVLYCRSYFGAGISGFGGAPYNFSLRFLILFFLFIAFVHSLHSERGTTFPDSYFLVKKLLIGNVLPHLVHNFTSGAAAFSPIFFSSSVLSVTVLSFNISLLSF